MAKKRYTLRKDGRYQTKITVNGKQKYLYGATKIEIDNQLLDIRIKQRQGIDLVSAQLSFEDWSKSWLKIKKSEVQPATYNKVKYPLTHLLARFGHYPIQNIKFLDIQDLLQDLSLENPSTGKPSAINTMKQVLNTATQIFNLAIQNQAITFNPTIGVVVPSFTRPKKRRALTQQEQQWIVSTPHVAQLPSMIMMFSGLRRGELIPLTWSDIDFKECTITVNKAVSYLEDTPSVNNHTKTAAGMRVIDIPNVLINFLKHQPRVSLLVAPQADGTMQSKSSWRAMWQDYLLTINKQHGDFTLFQSLIDKLSDEEKDDPKKIPFVIPEIGAHWLRHTFATMMYFADVDMVTAKNQMGHSDVKTMLDIYTHLDSIHKRKQMKKLDDYLSDFHA